MPSEKNWFSGFLIKAKDFYNHTWLEMPWLRAASTVLGTLGVLAYVVPQIFSVFGVDMDEPLFGIDFNGPRIAELAIGVVLIAYVGLAAIYAGDRLTAERKLRSVEQGFRYDNRGTLYNVHEENIAFRIATFKGILDGIAGEIGSAKLKEVLRDTGRNAARNFAENLPDIYNKDVARRKNNRAWDELLFEEKIQRWTDYDSATGWGILTAKVERSGVRVSVTHLEGLFSDASGTMFGNFLGGYCEVVVTAIARGQTTGRFKECDSAELMDVDTKGERTVEISLQLG